MSVTCAYMLMYQGRIYQGTLGQNVLKLVETGKTNPRIMGGGIFL